MNLSPITKTIGSPPIRHRSHTFASDRWLMDVDPKIFATRELEGISLWWRHNGRDSVSNHQPHDCLFNRLFGRRSKKTSKLRVTGLCVGNSPGTGEVPAQMASNAENVPIWWRHHVLWHTYLSFFHPCLVLLFYACVHSLLRAPVALPEYLECQDLKDIAWVYTLKPALTDHIVRWSLNSGGL